VPRAVILKTSPLQRKSAISLRPPGGGRIVRKKESVKTRCNLASHKSLGTHGGHKIAQCYGTQPDQTERKGVVKCPVYRGK
jgi:hypothetical protein